MSTRSHIVSMFHDFYFEWIVWSIWKLVGISAALLAMRGLMPIGITLSYQSRG